LDNEKLAEIYGISAMRAYILSGVISALLIVAGIWLYGTRAGVTPDVPVGLILTAVIATLIGGLGRVFSAAVAAVGLALLQSFSILFIASKWQGLLLYGVLFGHAGRRLTDGIPRQCRGADRHLHNPCHQL
jgi:branched-subunit amino acid ABC-type transport system permease component